MSPCLHSIVFIEFAIPAAVKGRDGSTLPFTCQSTVTLDGLRSQVAEKLRCYPGLLQLRYRLDTDKPRTSATSIQTEEELRIFKDRMRALLVPQRLANGKISTRILKMVRVSFEDAADDAITRLGESTGISKKVCLSCHSRSNFIHRVMVKNRVNHQPLSRALASKPRTRHTILWITRAISERR